MEWKERKRHVIIITVGIPSLIFLVLFVGFVFKGLGFTFCYEFWTEFV